VVSLPLSLVPPPVEPLLDPEEEEVWPVFVGTPGPWSPKPSPPPSPDAAHAAMVTAVPSARNALLARHPLNMRLTFFLDSDCYWYLEPVPSRQ
jgi:hypothetical protein